MAAAAPAAPAVEPKVTPKGVLLISTIPTYTLILKNDVTEIRKVNGKDRLVVTERGKTVKFLNHKAYITPELWKEVLAEKDPELTKLNYWYGIEWIDGEALAKLLVENEPEFDRFILRIKNILSRHCMQGKEPSELVLSRQIVKELKDAGLIK